VPAGGEEHSHNFGSQPDPPKVPVIVAFGLRPERIVGAEGRIDAVPEPPTQEQVGLLLEALRSGIAAGGYVIAIVPEWFPPDGLKRLEMARTLLDTDKVAIHMTKLPPLAATALASLASCLAPRLISAGLLASMLEPLESQLHAVTWLGSVTGLKHPAPSLGQHVASLTPGSAFAVSSYPEPAVHKIGTAQAIPLPQITRPSHLAIASRNGDDTWLTTTVNAQLGGLPVVKLEPTPQGASWWGTGKLAEGVICPVDVDRLASEIAQGAEPWACRWCGELIARSPCPMCGHRARPRRASPQHGART
jgi:hypothetical protein